MGNVHSVTGLHPCVSVAGAILPVLGEAESRFVERLRSVPPPSYISTARQVPSIMVHNPNVFSNRVPDRARAAYYLVVEGGGKWGYDQDFVDYLEALAPMLEDARFLLSDEYIGYVDAYEIRAGTLRVERLVQERGEAAEHARTLLADDPEALFELDRQEAEQWIRANEPEEALPWVERALEYRPDDPELLGERGHCLIALGRAEEGLDVLQGCLGALPAYELRTWGQNDTLLEVTNDVAEEVTVALKCIHHRMGRACEQLGRHEEALGHYTRSHSLTPTRGATAALDDRCALLLRLGRLPEAAAAIAELHEDAWDRPTVARAYHHLARLHARQGDEEAAVRDVSIALELRPQWRAELADDEDLAVLRERADFMGLVDPARR